ncbi:hypothetical protein MRBLMN1_002653 [Chitinophaga ginsengisegetis]|uniref:hypothetical protein n=1 Tax=Chitinophaga ginsengisegetis TaxID=393003 RepID=UPI000DB90E03|nr:hypothetical protein [Chitinophaga ginsengisegetis]MDR6568331.1 hypothetical protein [Chitinophaga ginsengisegetis]MDR6648438.1 hypothetical protein [Chitinophaga ginsengisegetis]MDR6654412.1 hypothetical protein [Chitinophaga ginsengisegetis]
MFETTAREFRIGDEDGFIGIVNATAYHSFVDNDWELGQLFRHFTQAINDETLIVWETSPGGGDWTVEFLESASGKDAFRQFESSIVVTDDRLYLTNYTDLTMAAQFEDCVIPDKLNADLYITLTPGRYHCTVRQMFVPGDEGDRFEVILQPTTQKGDNVSDVYWNTSF